MNKKIYFQEDLIKKYSDSRKDISYDEVEDLLKSLVAYIRDVADKEEVTQLNLKNIGIFHKIIDYDLYKEIDLSKKAKNNTKMIIAEALGDKLFSAKKKRKQKNEIQEHVNNNHPIKNKKNQNRRGS